jgi:hypothetical protein
VLPPEDLEIFSVLGLTLCKDRGPHQEYLCPMGISQLSSGGVLLALGEQGDSVTNLILNLPVQK